MKPGRELEHYPHYDSVPSVSHDKCSVIKTEFAGRPCILKVNLANIYTYNSDGSESKDVFRKPP